jgi:hypothetical protein
MQGLITCLVSKLFPFPGFKYRIMNALIPGSLSREITGKIIKKPVVNEGLRSKSHKTNMQTCRHYRH